MNRPEIVLMTDHRSAEGSRAMLTTAVRELTGRPAVLMDAGMFMAGGSGRACWSPGQVQLRPSPHEEPVTASTVIVYEIPPERRRGFEPFQRLLREHAVATLGGANWRAATEKNLTVERFIADHIAHMPTVTMSQPAPSEVSQVFDRLGRNVWARPAIGLGGRDVFHIDSDEQLHAAAGFYAGTGQDWLLSRDAGNFNSEGLRHQFRVVVLNGRVVRAVEHVQPDPNAPCNEGQGAKATLLDPRGLPAGLADLAIRATASVGLAFGGVDLAAENGGVVFEVNVHPMFGTVRGLETAAIPYVQAHLDLL